eukprot:6202811-Pleurochrysis_carterae.AAC.1
MRRSPRVEGNGRLTSARAAGTRRAGTGSSPEVASPLDVRAQPRKAAAQAVAPTPRSGARVGPARVVAPRASGVRTRGRCWVRSTAAARARQHKRLRRRGRSIQRCLAPRLRAGIPRGARTSSTLCPRYQHCPDRRDRDWRRGRRCAMATTRGGCFGWQPAEGVCNLTNGFERIRAAAGPL